MAGRGRERQRREHAVRIGRAPLQHLHPAHRAAGDREQLRDAEVIEQHRLRPHHVVDGDDGKIKAPRLTRLRVGRGRAGRAHAAADHVRANDEIALRVDRPAGADHGLPPARLARDRMDIGDMLIAGERVADQHGVRALRIQRAISLIGDLERREFDACVELERLVRTEQDKRRARPVRFADAIRRIVFCGRPNAVHHCARQSLNIGDCSHIRPLSWRGRPR